METLTKVFAAIVAIVLLGFFGAVVIRAYWGWFIVPLNVPPIGLAHAYGLAMFVRMMTWQVTAPKREDMGLAAALLAGFMYYGFVVFFGWVIQGLM